MLEVIQCGIRPTQFAPAKREAEEFALLDRRHPALLLIDRQLQAPAKVRGKTGLDTLARSRGLDQNDEIVGIPGEPVTSPLQFPVQIIGKRPVIPILSLPS